MDGVPGPPPWRAGLDLDAASPTVLGEYPGRECPQVDVPTSLFEPPRQVVGEDLRAAHRVVVAQEVRESQHRVEDERGATRRRPPVRNVGSEQQSQLSVADVVVERLT